MRTRPPAPAAARGVTLVELCIALVILAGGILALGGLFPAGSREQNKDRMMAEADLYAQQKVEQLQGKLWSDPDLSLGRHPAGLVNEDLGNSGTWHRHYTVSSVAAPLDNLKRVDVVVEWTFQFTTRSVTATIYTRR